MIKDCGRLPRRVEYGRAAQGEALWAKVSTQLLHSWTNYLQEALNEDENTVAEAFNDNKKSTKADMTIQTTVLAFLLHISGVALQHERSYYQLSPPFQTRHSSHFEMS